MSIYYHNKKNKKNWQKNYITEVFKNSNKLDNNYFKIVLNNKNLLATKDLHLPNRLFKFYSPTSDSILDIKNRRLWLSNPDSFNDPFDCKIGYDKEEYEKYCLLNFIKTTGYVDEINSQDGFTLNEFNRISRSSTKLNYRYFSKLEEYWDVNRKVVQNKSDDFQNKIRKLLIESTKQADNKIQKLRSGNIRVACLSELDEIDLYSKIQMWGHYADNHRGFCVEYDVTSLKVETTLSLGDYYKDENTFTNEGIKAVIKCGIFSVIYTSKRINIPVTKLDKIKINNEGNLNYSQDIEEIIYKSYIVKSTNWSYEKEWRIILDENICKYHGNKIPFPYIKKIYLGCKMSEQTINAMLEIGKELGVNVVIMKMDGSKFQLQETSAEIYEWNKEFKTRWNNPYRKLLS